MGHVLGCCILWLFLCSVPNGIYALEDVVDVKLELSWVEEREIGERKKRRHREMRHSEIRKEKGTVYVREKMQAEGESVCAVKRDKLGHDLGRETQGEGTETDKSMACFNRGHRAAVSTAPC